MHYFVYVIGSDLRRKRVTPPHIQTELSAGLGRGKPYGCLICFLFFWCQESYPLGSATREAARGGIYYTSPDPYEKLLMLVWVHPALPLDTPWATYNDFPEHIARYVQGRYKWHSEPK